MFEREDRLRSCVVIILCLLVKIGEVHDLLSSRIYTVHICMLVVDTTGRNNHLWKQKTIS